MYLWLTCMSCTCSTALGDMNCFNRDVYLGFSRKCRFLYQSLEVLHVLTDDFFVALNNVYNFLLCLRLTWSLFLPDLLTYFFCLWLPISCCQRLFVYSNIVSCGEFSCIGFCLTRNRIFYFAVELRYGLLRGSLQFCAFKSEVRYIQCMSYPIQ